jgi:hypothetical protein
VTSSKPLSAPEKGNRKPYLASGPHTPNPQARKLPPTTTQIYFEGGEWVDDDCVGGVKDDLMAKLEKHDDPSDYRQRGLDEPYYIVNYDFVLVPAREEVEVPL